MKIHDSSLNFYYLTGVYFLPDGEAVRVMAAVLAS
jgi:hypothetical protein